MTFARAFDAVAMATWPWVARAFGYTFRVGENLASDGHIVLRTVWDALGVTPPSDVAWVGERYDRATTWIVAYRAGKPVGVMGLLDMRVACVSLDYDRRGMPPGLDLARTREVGRLAILRGHRGGRHVVMVGLLREMLKWCLDNGVTLLFSGSKRSLFDVYARYNPSARLIETPAAPPEDEALARYFAPVRAYGGPGVHYTFEVAGARPWQVFSQFLLGRLGR